MHKIFISYSRKDYSIVVKLRDEIERLLGQRMCWIDLTGIESDSQFVEVIVDAINKADTFLFMHSKNSEQSEWTRKEIMYANGKGKKIVIVKVDDSSLSDYFAFQFAGHDIIYLSDKKQKQKLMNNLKSWYQNGLRVPEEVMPPKSSMPSKFLYAILTVVFIMSIALFFFAISNNHAVDPKPDPHPNFIDTISPILIDSL